VEARRPTGATAPRGRCRCARTCAPTWWTHATRKPSTARPTRADNNRCAHECAPAWRADTGGRVVLHQLGAVGCSSVRAGVRWGSRGTNQNHRRVGVPTGWQVVCRILVGGLGCGRRTCHGIDRRRLRCRVAERTQIAVALPTCVTPQMVTRTGCDVDTIPAKITGNILAKSTEATPDAQCHRRRTA
jgi:hypothetical protein